MRNKALTLSDGSEVHVSQHQIEILGSDESLAARRIEHARSVRAAVSSWAERQCEMLVDQPRASNFYKAVSAHQHRNVKAGWVLGLVAETKDCALLDPDIVSLRSWVFRETSD
jgi:hypothetical protein